MSLCKRRGFVFPGSEIYGGLANSWDYGPLGVELKNNLRDWWWKRFVQSRDDMVGIDASILMNSKVWEASGHLQNFADPLVECKECHQRFRADDLLEKSTKRDFKSLFFEFVQKQKTAIKNPKIWEVIEKILKEEEVTKTNPETGEVTIGKVPKNIAIDFLSEKYKDIFWAIYSMLGYYQVKCLNCREMNWNQPQKFNLMFKTAVGSTEEKSADIYLRPEIAQAMFVQFKNVLDTTRKRLPFGIASVGKAFRNEITPGNFIFRTLEFDLMEFEYFIRESEWEKYFEYWLKEQQDWLAELGFSKHNLRLREHEPTERAHYSKRTVDLEYNTPFGWKEMFGLAYRTDFDLKNHMEKSGVDLQYTDPESGEKFIPHVIEPTFGLTRLLLMVLLESYYEEKDRVVLKLHPKLAPYKVAVFPLLANKPQLVAKAREIYQTLQKHFSVAWDDRGNVGKRYYSQDEIGTPFCITVDFDTLENSTVTVRDRDTKQQPRVKIGELVPYLGKFLR